MSKSSLFQLYLDNFFEFPDDIKNDLVYCQRAFQAHIKVHQMVIDVFLEQKDADPIQKQRILNELENELYEINAEQNYIMLHLRKIIKEFYNMLKENNITVDQNATNAFISRQLIGLISDKNVIVKPMRVQQRSSEEKLIEKYFEVQDQKNVYEILDSDEEVEAKSEALTKTISSELNALSPKSETTTIDLTNSKESPTTTTNHNNNNKHALQESLLKPMAQRMPATTRNSLDPSSYLEVNLHESHATTSMPCDRDKSGAPASSITAPLVQDSTNVKMSRMNLRQALKKVQNENLAKVAARKMARSSEPSAFVEPTAPPAQTIATNRGGAFVQRRKSVSVSRQRNSPPSVATINNVPIMSVKQLIEPPRPVGRPPGSNKLVTNNNKSPDTTKATAANKSPDSSDNNSNSERQSTPPQNGLPAEPKDTRENPSDYGKEPFLHMFGLFTHDMKTIWQQRRSKRRRRCVQSNERADFHYGRFEYASNVPPPVETKKKRRDFLLSPQLKAKRVKRANTEDKESLSSRSSSSSPDDKNGCNECLKGGGILDPCSVCKGFYHQTCHREMDEKPIKKEAANRQSGDDKKICPACIRLVKNNGAAEDFPKKALQSLEDKFGKERSKRRANNSNYQISDKTYKTQEFHNPKSIKRADDLDSSE